MGLSRSVQGALGVLALVILVAPRLHAQPNYQKPLQYSPPVFLCPTGFSLAEQSKECSKVAYLPQLPKCPDDYKFSGRARACIHDLQTSPTRSCPKGAVLNGFKCEITIYEQMEPYCPNGFSHSGKECQRTLTAAGTQTCEKGFSLRGGQCERKRTAAPQFFCESGELNGSQCRVDEISMVQIECPNGFDLTDGGQCVRSQFRKASERCPKGTSRGSKGCESVASPSRICEKGRLQGNSCLSDLVVPVEIRCPSGWDMDNKGDCTRVLVEEPTLSCPKGSRLRNGNCVGPTSKHSYEPEKGCKDSSWELEDKNSCVKILTRVPMEECPAGSSKRGKSCTRRQAEESLAVCPDGYFMEGSACMQIAAAEFECPSAYDVAGEGECVRTEQRAPTEKCEGGEAPTKNGCIRSTSTAALRTCPNGYSMEGKGCVAEELSPPRFQCQKGYEECSAGQKQGCCKVVRQGPQMRCPQGTKSVGKGKCARYDSYDAKMDCGNAKLDATGLICYKRSTAPVSYICPPNYRMEEGKKCSTILRATPEISCPNGFRLNSLKQCIGKGSKGSDYDGGW